MRIINANKLVESQIYSEGWFNALRELVRLQRLSVYYWAGRHFGHARQVAELIDNRLAERLCELGFTSIPPQPESV